MLIINKLTFSYVSYYTIQSLIGFSALRIMFDEDEKFIDELYFIQTKTTFRWPRDNGGHENIEESLCEYRIRFTRAVEKKIISFIASLEETRPNGETWKDNSMYKLGRPKFKYFAIKELEWVLAGCYFQEYECTTEASLYKTGKTLSAFFQEDIYTNKANDKFLYINMSYEEQEDERLSFQNNLEQPGYGRNLKDSKDDWMDGDESNYWNID